MKKPLLGRVELSIYFILLFFILKEWLSPIMVLTKTGYLNLILLFIALSLFLKWLKAPFYLSSLIKIVYIGWFIVYVYTDAPFFSIDGLSFLLNEIKYNLSFLVKFDFASFTNPFRSVLLFILIWMVVYLIHYWIVYKLNIFSFLFLSVAFIATLDTFTEYDGTYAIVKIIFIGLIMSSFLYVRWLMHEKEIQFDYKKYIKIASPIIIVVVCLGFASILLPKASPIWPDPVPYIKSVVKSDGLFGRNKVSKVGYDEDDSRLGGPFEEDDTLLFKVIDTKRQYWRVETKDFYTSKGWETSSQFSGNSYYDIGEEIYYRLFPENDKKTETATIINENNNDFIIYPYGLKSFQLGQSDNVFLEMNDATEKFRFMEFSSSDAEDEVPEELRYFRDSSPVIKKQYLVEYNPPAYRYSDLTKLKLEEVNFGGDFKKIYLQLPDTLPQRVRDLANEIVKDEKTIYEKARAIEMYFRMNGFRYDTKNVPVPEEDQDYVDQFLFETKVGYCDNFSTAMVVLLRAAGIPARWVKGFVTGNIVEIDNGKNVYEITNNEAHSWVEAYISGVGWVEFEPTLGFTNNRSIEYDTNTGEKQKENQVEVKEETKPEGTKEDVKRENEKPKESADLFANLKDYVKKHKLLFVVILFVVMAIIVALIIMAVLRRKWMWKLSLHSLKNKPLTKENFEKHYLLLLKVLETKGLKRQDGQTLSAFAKEVDEKYNTNAMTEITSAYEKFIYSKEQENIDFKKMKEIWESFISSRAS